MIKDEEGRKWACQPCITGHRTGTCQHFDSPVRETRPPGRPTKGKSSEPPVFWILTKIHKGGQCMGKPLHKVNVHGAKNGSPASSASESPGVALTPPRACCSGKSPEATMSIPAQSLDSVTEQCGNLSVISETDAADYDLAKSDPRSHPSQTWQWALNSQTIDPTHSCTCGPNCQCSFCLVHLNNEATTKAVQGFAQNFMSQNGNDLLGSGLHGLNWGPSASQSTFAGGLSGKSGGSQPPHSLYQQPTIAFGDYLPSDAPFSPDPSYQQVAFPIMRTPSAMGGAADSKSLGDPAMEFSYQVGAPVIPAAMSEDTFDPHFNGSPAFIQDRDMQTPHYYPTHQPVQRDPRIFVNETAHTRESSLDMFTSTTHTIPNPSLYHPNFSPHSPNDWRVLSGRPSTSHGPGTTHYTSIHGQPIPYGQPSGFHPSMVTPQSNFPFTQA